MGCQPDQSMQVGASLAAPFCHRCAHLCLECFSSRGIHPLVEALFNTLSKNPLLHWVGKTDLSADRVQRFHDGESFIESDEWRLF